MAYKDYVLPVPVKGYSPIIRYLGEQQSAANTYRIYAPGEQWGIKHVVIAINMAVLLTTSAVVANRNIEIKRVLDENFTPDYVKSANVAASTSFKMKLGKMVYFDSTASKDNEQAGYTDLGLVLQGNDYFQITIANAQAGDVYKPYCEFRYMNYEWDLKRPTWQWG